MATKKAPTKAVKKAPAQKAVVKKAAVKKAGKKSVAFDKDTLAKIRTALTGVLSKSLVNQVIDKLTDGDPTEPPPPPTNKKG